MIFDLISGTDSNLILAYLDPGLGSMQLQIVVAALMSASFFVKASFSQAKEVIGRILKKTA